MGGLLRKLTISICVPIYKLIKWFYSIFYNLANTRFLEDDTIQQLSANIYVLVSVVMLFAFSVTILSAIVNPDLLNDSKKGVAAAFKRAIIGLALMVVIPFIFDEIYVVQKNIMDNSLIEKIIVGADFRCDQNEDGECEAGANGGQVIAGNLISAVLYPVADNVQISENISDKYEKMITTDIRYIGAVSKHINVTTEGDNAYHSDFDDEDYAFNWDGLVAIIAGCATCYILLLFAIDMAVRVFKLAFLELTAPISIVAYMASGDKVLKSWGQEVLKTFLDVFVRIAAIAFYLFLIKNLSTYMSKFDGKDWSFVVKVLLIVGMLIFVKQIPDLINKMFGTNINLKGGVGGRLGEMALVGKQAQAAWGAVKQAAKIGAVGAGLVASGPVGWGAAGAGIGLGVGANQLWKNKLKNTKFGQGVSAIGSGASAVGKTAGAYLKGKGLSSGFKDAKKAYSESDFGLQHISDRKYNKAIEANEKFNNKMGFNRNGEAIDAVKSLSAFTLNSDKDLGKVRAGAIQQLNTANLRKATIDQISSDKDAIISELDSLKTNAKTTAAVNAIEGIKNSFATGKMSSNEMRTKLNALIDAGEIDSSSGFKISGKLDSIENRLDNNLDLKHDLVGDNGELKVGSDLKDLKRSVEKSASLAKSNYDTVYGGSSESVKKEMDNYAAASDEIISKYVKEQGKADDGSNINTVGTHQKGSANRVEVHSNPSTTTSSSNGSSTQNSSSSSSASNSNSTNTQGNSSTQNNSTSNTSSDDTDDALEAMMNAQIEVNEERLNNAWKNQSTDDTYRRGTYEPDKNNNNSNDSYEDIFANQYDNNDSNSFTGTDDE